jgi:diguanylate cyclase (GGDEF)-like protein/PAS domain S-box-containing protein
MAAPWPRTFALFTVVSVVGRALAVTDVPETAAGTPPPGGRRGMVPAPGDPRPGPPGPGRAGPGGRLGNSRGVLPVAWRRGWMAAYAAWMVLLAAVYFFAVPAARVPAWGLFTLTGVLAIAAGIQANRPARSAPWLLLATANLSFALGQFGFLVLSQVRHEHVPYPSWLDVFYLATYPLYAAGLLLFIRYRSAGRYRRSLLEALTLIAGLALLGWIYLILPHVHNPALTWEHKAVALAYPVGDAAMLAMLAMLLTPGTWRNRSAQLLTLGTLGLLASDVAFGMSELYGTFRPASVTDLGLVVFYLAWGAAALHPSMTALTEPSAGRPASITLLRLGLLLVASLVAPGVLLAQALGRSVRDLGVIAVCSAVLYVLVLAQLAEVATALRRAMARAETLRVTGAALAAATTLEQAAGAIRAGVTALGGRGEVRPALLAVRDVAGPRVVGAPPGDPPVRMDLPAVLATSWAELGGSTAPRLLDPGPGAAAGEAILACPLVLRDRPSGDPLTGLLAVFGPRARLAGQSSTLEVLARQAALVVERLVLNREVIQRNSEAYFRTLVQDTSDVILIIDADGRVQYATPSAATLFGEVPADGARLWDLVQPDERGEIASALADMRDSGGRDLDEDWRITSRWGTYAEVEVRCSDLRREPTVGGFVLTLRDVTVQRQLERELSYRAFHDALTGLPNRVLFSDRVVRALARAASQEGTVGVLFVDLDDFKVINDTLGHTVGDELLVAASQRLTRVAGPGSVVARLGGDEFALLIEDAAGPGAVETTAETIVEAFAGPFSLAVGSAIATATVGVATSQDSATPGDLVRHADLALYAAKAAGKRQWRHYQPVLSAGMQRRRELQEALEVAVSQSAFTVVYQPIVDLVGGDLAGFEALVRWPHPEWGMINPEQFIALAEETGHIVPLGSWVLGQALAAAQRWQHDLPGLYVSVNVSARQLQDPGFVRRVRQALAASGLVPSALLLELTETVLIRPDERIRADLAELRRMGARLAIDDFGTGYSSLSYLRELPISVLKVDKSFVDGIATSPQRLALAEVIIRIAKTLGLSVVAEGIETEAQRDLLMSMGCRYGQGFLFSGPVPAAEAAQLVRDGPQLLPRLPARSQAPT